MNVPEKSAENKDVCAYRYVLRCKCTSMRSRVHKSRRVCVCVCTEVSANSSTHRSLVLESPLSTLAVDVPA